MTTTDQRTEVQQALTKRDNEIIQIIHEEMGDNSLTKLTLLRIIKRITTPAASSLAGRAS